MAKNFSWIEASNIKSDIARGLVTEQDLSKRIAELESNTDPMSAKGLVIYRQLLKQIKGNPRKVVDNCKD